METPMEHRSAHSVSWASRKVLKSMAYGTTGDDVTRSLDPSVAASMVPAHSS
jgi:hypothetical protein